MQSPGPSNWFDRLAAVAGMTGPALLGGTIAGLTYLQYDFLRSLRWHPTQAPTTDWPSGLALGPYGDVMVAMFVCSGVMLIGFALGLHRSIAGQPKVGPLLLAVSGAALALLAFKTDPTYRSTPTTLAGRIHDSAFVLLGLSLLPAMLSLSQAFRRDARWRGYTLYTLLTLALIAPAFVLKGAAFYLFLIGIMLWFEMVAIRLWRIGRASTTRVMVE